MDAARWERIEAICLAALDRPPEERAAYVREASAGDTGLIEDIEGLLAQLEEAPAFLETPLARVAQLSPEEADEGATPAGSISAYRLVRPLGRGGMGEVFLAVHEGQGFEQVVALKVIKRGMDTDDVLERFRLERQILASLHHPNIALLLDGGATDDGRPYFVMEYVEGVPIDRYCESQALPVRARLQLFQTICSAVQHAHANLVVHRDLKPSNVLVTADGTPKLLDFGIGKVLDPSSVHVTPVRTRTDVRVLTPEFAAPEQLRGEPPTTATDVYGLGALLYRLLTGQPPHARTRAAAEVERSTEEAAPRRPSQVAGRRLRRRLEGDLDTIVLKALRNDPARRYTSATAFADDIQRYLEGLPVKARPDTLAYRAGKFLRRHMVGVAAAAVVFVALTWATLWTQQQSRRVARERDKAVEVQGFLLETFGAGGADRATGDTVTARKLLDRQAAAIDEAYGDRPDLLAAMLAVLAEGYERLGLFHDAESPARRALELRLELYGSNHPDVGVSTNSLGWILFRLDRTDDAEALLREAVRIRREGGGRDRVDLARALNDLGVLRLELGDIEEAEALHRESLALRLQALGENHLSVGVSASNLSAVLYQRRDLDGAVAAAEQALRALRSALGPDHQRTAIVQSNLAALKAATGDREAAETDYRDLLERQTRLLGREHPVTTQTMFSLAAVLNSEDKFAEAESLAVEVLAIREATLGSAHRNLAGPLVLMGRARSGQRDFEGAIGALERALTIERVAYANAPRIPTSLGLLAQLQERRGDYPAAERYRRELLGATATARGDGHVTTETQRVRLGAVLLKEQDFAAAARLLRRSHEVALRDFRDHPLTQTSRLYLAQAALGLGDVATADSLLAESRSALAAGKLSTNQRSVLADLERLRDSLADR